MAVAKHPGIGRGRGGGRPRAEVPTVQLSFRLREDEAAMLRAASERLAVSPGRLLGRMIRAAFEPAALEVAPESLPDRPEEE